MVGKRVADRIGVFDVSGRPRVVDDAWVDREEVSGLAARLSDVPAGGWDAMFATWWSWRWAWGGAPFTLWSRSRVRARVTGQGRLAIRTVGSTREIAVLRVVGEVSESWLVQRVGVVTPDGRFVWLARNLNLGPVFDPGYDGLCMLADASWAGALGNALAGALGVPYEGNDVAVGGKG